MFLAVIGPGIESRAISHGLRTCQRAAFSVKCLVRPGTDRRGAQCAVCYLYERYLWPPRLMEDCLID